MDFWLLALAALAGPAVFALVRFAGIGRRHTAMIEQDWARADAAATIAAMTRANARRAMEWLLTTDPERAAQIAEKIEANTRAIEAAIGMLEQLLDLPEERLLLARIKQERARYQAALEQGGRLIGQGRRVQSSALLLESTLPALDGLIAALGALSDWQRGAGPRVRQARLRVATALAPAPFVSRGLRAGPGTNDAAAPAGKKVANGRAGGPDEWRAC